MPSPLSHFQSYDGLQAGESGIGELIAKVGTQLGMAVPEVLIKALAEAWIITAKDHQPDSSAPISPAVSPEALSQFDSLVARLEGAIDSIRTPMPPTRGPAARSVNEARERMTRLRNERMEFLSGTLGNPATMYEDADEFVRTLDAARADTKFTLRDIDVDGDAVINVEDQGRTDFIFLRSPAIADLPQSGFAPTRLRNLIRDIEEAKKSRV